MISPLDAGAAWALHSNHPALSLSLITQLESFEVVGYKSVNYLQVSNTISGNTSININEKMKVPRFMEIYFYFLYIYHYGK